ncbi:MAG: cation diffusion facilitator family transporter, partial [Candidatus Thorarchaeota archaeon]
VLSERNADEKHMFGYGRAQNVAALVAATLFLSLTSLTLFEEAAARLLTPEVEEYRNTEIGIMAIFISIFLTSFTLFFFLIKKDHGSSSKAQKIELINDELALFAVLLGILFTMIGYPIADSIATLIVGTIIAINAIRLFKENMCYLIGKAPELEYMEIMKSSAQGVEGVLNVIDIKAEYISKNQIFASLTVQVDPKITAEKITEITKKIGDILKAKLNCQLFSINIGIP